MREIEQCEPLLGVISQLGHLHNSNENLKAIQSYYSSLITTVFNLNPIVTACNITCPVC